MSEWRVGDMAVVLAGIRIVVMRDPQLRTRRQKIYAFRETRRRLVRWNLIKLFTPHVVRRGHRFFVAPILLSARQLTLFVGNLQTVPFQPASCHGTRTERWRRGICTGLPFDVSIFFILSSFTVSGSVMVG